MRRSILQCVISASQASCSVALQGFEPPSHNPFIVRHSGTGICCVARGGKCESWAEEMVATTSKRTATCGSRDLMEWFLRLDVKSGRQYKTFQNGCPLVASFAHHWEYVTRNCELSAGVASSSTLLLRP